jgi:integrase
LLNSRARREKQQQILLRVQPRKMATTFKDSSGANGAGKYVKVPAYPGLYRHSRSGRYYGFKKLNGKRHECSLRTTDRKIAERRLKDWVRNLAAVDREVEKTTLRDLLARFVAVNRGRALKTQKTNRAIIRQLTETWPGGVEVQVRHIRPSHLDEWLALHEPRLRNTTYNAYASLLKRLFEIAVNDRIIAQSPFDLVRTNWKRPQDVIRRSPTAEQFVAIVSSIRSQRFTDHAKDSADFVEFMGLAGLGQAEASSITWGDVDCAANQFRVRRHKTDKWFTVEIYPHLRPFLERLKAEAGPICPESRIFKINDAKKALKAACARLGLPNFSQRSLRQFLVRHLLRHRVDYKLSKPTQFSWQRRSRSSCCCCTAS